MQTNNIVKKISLIQTSQNRRAELERFVNSLNQQEGIDFSAIQFIFVDQGDNRVISITGLSSFM